MNKRKIFRAAAAFALAAAMTLSFGACGGSGDSDEGNVGTENPVVEVKSADELCKVTNISIDAPEGAEYVTYSYIESDEGQDPIGQVEFILDGREYTYRAMATGMLSLDESLAGTDYEGQDLAGAMMDGAEVCTELHGMYGKWDAAALTVVTNRDGVCALNEGKEGLVLWLDVVPGVLYSLTVSDGADQEALIQTAEKSFVPVQGEVDGDE